ncbi:HalOD1 output domain-containing protein [Saliphagus sp. GCM10025334]
MAKSDREGDAQLSEPTATRLRKTYDWSVTAPSLAVIDALATIESVDPTELLTVLETTLYDYVDPEALDIFVREQKSDPVTVTLWIDRYRVRFDSDELVVSEASDPSSP